MIKLKIENSTEPKIAGKKPPTVNPGARNAARPNKAAFIIKVNNPSVRMFIGNVRNIISGLINILTREITATANNAAKNPTISMPGTILATRINARASIIHLKIEINIVFLLICL